jgi:hypothetical protein
VIVFNSGLIRLLEAVTYADRLACDLEAHARSRVAPRILQAF